MKLFHFAFKAMGTPCEIQLFATKYAAAKRITELAIADVHRLEFRYSRYRDDSFLSEINRVAAKGGSIQVDGETAGLLNYSQQCFEQSGELFDITSGILRRAWDFKSNRLPGPEQIRGLLDKIGWRKLHWEAPLLEFPVAGMEMDFGGVVKEYAVDRAATICEESGGRHGLINLGGDIKIIGARPDGQQWRVGIRNPGVRGSSVKTLLLNRGAIASSGDYERCITLNGVRYGHILNPKTGWPVQKMASVTVVGDFCLVAGSAATIGMLQENHGPGWLNDLGLPHYWIDVDGNTGGSLEQSAIESA
ncbi:MAG: FAD:protein FMN transferase [Methylococcaceae bacterium]|nr:FAD:protein FMN transferase [Methylococcaceae bacterium]